MDVMREELGHKELEGDVATLREKYQRDFESLKVFSTIYFSEPILFGDTRKGHSGQLRS